MIKSPPQIAEDILEIVRSISYEAAYKEYKNPDGSIRRTGYWLADIDTAVREYFRANT